MLGQALSKRSQSLLTRLGASCVALVLASLVFFSLLELAPGDFATASATRSTTEAQMQAFRFEHGLHEPTWYRYLRWLGSAAQGEFGESWWLRKPVAGLVLEAFGHSLWLASWALLIGIPIGLLLGYFAAVARQVWVDRALCMTVLGITSVPEFVVAYAVLIGLTLYLDLFPAHALFALDMSLTERLYLSGPAIISLAILVVAPVLRATRANVLHVFRMDYMEMAALKGVPRRRAVLRHAVPNLIAPVANSLVLVAGNLMVGMVIVETIYSYPGAGHLMVGAAKLQDAPLLLACGVMAATIYVGLNWLADVIAVWGNPVVRQRLGTQLVASRWLRAGTSPDARQRWTQRVAFACVLLLLVAGGVRYALTDVDDDLNYAEAPAPGDTRGELTLRNMLDANYRDRVEPVHFGYFDSVGRSGPALEPLTGTLSWPAFAVFRRPAHSTARNTGTRFPPVRLTLKTEGQRLLIAERDQLLAGMEGDDWHFIVADGRVWSEPDDLGWSRAAFPFTLIGQAGFGTRNGVAAFLYRDGKVSDLRVQVAQEGAFWNRFDVWGQGDANLAPQSGTTLTVAERARVHSRYEVKPWSALEADHGKRALSQFDGEHNRNNISASALMVGDDIYLRTCRTRLGPYPFCREMRHAVFSISKTLGGALSLLRLAEVYGEEVLDERIVDYVDIPASHDGWRDVTFRDTINMATGIGNLTPERVDYYVETDDTRLAGRIAMAPTVSARIALIASFANYPWAPGEVFRYRTSDTFLLGVALNRYLKQKRGPDANIWDMLKREVFEPLGLPGVMTVSAQAGDGYDRVPRFGAGMLMTVEEAFALARLMQDGGKHNGQQLLHAELTRAVTSFEYDRGLPNGWRQADGRQGHYDFSFWLTPHTGDGGCELRIPTMAGIGGNYIQLFPRDVIGLRFADGIEANPGTWDSSGIRATADAVRPFCHGFGVASSMSN